MGLEYIDNVDYNTIREESVDALLEQMIEQCGVDVEAGALYEALHRKVMREVVAGDLAITTIMPDLLDLLHRTPQKAMLLMRLLADPYASYSELGEQMHLSKQRVAVILHELGRRYKWLDRLLAIHNAPPPALKS